MTRIKCYQYELKKIEGKGGPRRFMVFCRHRNGEHFCSLKEVSIGNDGCKAYDPALADSKTNGRAFRGTQ